MPGYIIPRNGGIEHYFYKKGDGICCRVKTSGRFQNKKVIFKDGIDGFCVCKDQSDNIHMVCTDNGGDIFYLINKGGDWYKHSVSGGNGKIFPQDMHLILKDGRLSLIYIAKYNGDTLLIYCVLGINSKPVNMGILSAEYPSFCIWNQQIYFTRSDGTLGYMDFSDGKPENFIPISQNAGMPCVIQHDEEMCILYKKENSIIFNNTPVYDDAFADRPILCINDGKLMMLWKSAGFVRYSASQNGGATWSSPMRFVNSEKSNGIYYVQINGELYPYYGIESSDDLTLLCAPDMLTLIKPTADTYSFAPANEKPASEPPRQSSDSIQLELQKIKIMVELLKNDISQLKKTVAYMTKPEHSGKEPNSAVKAEFGQ